MKTLERHLDLNKTIKSYQKLAWFYNLWSNLTESKAAAAVIELAEIKDHQSILEIACGTGILFEKLVSKNPNGNNIGIDLSPEMLSKAKSRMKKTSFKNYVLEEGNALALKFKDESFDIVINNFMIDLMPEESFNKIAKEFYRLLKPNGITVISNFSFGKKKVNKFWY